MKYVKSFEEGNKNERNLLGGKGANLSEMTNIGLPVPRGFTITTEACTQYYNNKETLSEEIVSEIFAKVKELEEKTGKTFGSKENPLLVSVRSGARVSMPGMMDTVLNLGLNDEVAESFAKITNNERFVYDSYRRFIQMFSDVVKGYPKSSFEKRFDEIKEQKGVKLDTELTAEDLKEVINTYKEEYRRLDGNDFPSDPKVQLIEAVKAVFRSWMNERAIYYRKINEIPSSWGTAVNVQEMVFGNKNEMSGTGVAFTRNPSTGENKLFGEFLMNAQGEDVVAGIRTPKSIETLKDVMPECYDEFIKVCKTLETHYKDMQDMEFTIEDGKLFMLQTRNGKRTTAAAIKIAVDMESVGLITKEEALLRVEAKSLNQLLHPTFDETVLKSSTPIATGLAASPGAATGKICFTAKDALIAHNNGEKDLILVRDETSPEDIEGMNIASGILTKRGGMTSHAAVVARGLGTCCVCGCSSIVVNEENKTLVIGEHHFAEGDYISLDGSTGNVYPGKIETKEAEISGDFKTFMSWADEVRKLKIKTNADTPKDAMTAIKFGAEGIGLCRTEHMFFESERIFNFRKMILADTEEKRVEALNNILPYQEDDFEKLFEVMNDLPVTIRLLDPPLHEFLPHTLEEKESLASSLGITIDSINERIDYLKEFNPMMGHRGCRLDVTYPEIAKMQTTAIIGAAIKAENKGIKTHVQIMVPLVGSENEIKFVKNIIDETAGYLMDKMNKTIEYKVGTMIEIPRAALVADKLAKHAEFFSFGTNDLTQMTFGFSRDDAGKFLNSYYEKGVFETDPFSRIDTEGVGQLMRLAVSKGKSTRPDLEVGICGEQAGDGASVEFCNEIGLNYVSCSPYRIVIARLAAAQATIKLEANK